MRISARCDYACRALLELALHWPKPEALQIGDISQKQNIPIRYLVQILLQLKQLGFVTSTRGNQGGYNLAKAPSQIRLGQVIREIAGPLLPIANVDSETKRSVFTAIWDELEEAMAKILDSITFEDICRKAKAMDTVIIYEI